MKKHPLLILIALVIIAWQLLYMLIGDVALRSPYDTTRLLVKMLGSANFLPHMNESLKAFFEAYVIAIIIGLIIGVALGTNRLMREAFEPVLVAVYSIPKVTLYPIILLFFGIGFPAKVAFGTIHGIVPVALFTMNAVSNIRPVYIKTSKVLKLSLFSTFQNILIRAALPEILTGLRVGFSLTLIGTLLGEMFGAQRGIGYLLMQAMSMHHMDNMMALTFLVVLFAAGANGCLLLLEKKINKHM